MAQTLVNFPYVTGTTESAVAGGAQAESAVKPFVGRYWLFRAYNLVTSLLSSHSGSSRPSYAVLGTVWLDTDTNALYLYNGTTDQLISAGGLRSMIQPTLTIASGAITPTLPGTILIDTEASGATDDLDTITATNLMDGDILVIKAANTARTVVIKNGTGNIRCGSDRTLDNTRDRIVLQWDSAESSFVLLAFSDNGA